MNLNSSNSDNNNLPFTNLNMNNNSTNEDINMNNSQNNHILDDFVANGDYFNENSLDVDYSLITSNNNMNNFNVYDGSMSMNMNLNNSMRNNLNGMTMNADGYVTNQSLLLDNNNTQNNMIMKYTCIAQCLHAKACSKRTCTHTHTGLK